MTEFTMRGSLTYFAFGRLVFVGMSLALSAVSVHSEDLAQIAESPTESSLPEKELGRLCTEASRAYVRDFVEKRDGGMQRQDALTSAENDWTAFRRRANLDVPYNSPPLTEVQQAHLRKLAEKLSFLTYELSKANSETLEAVLLAQCDRARTDRRLLTTNEIKIRTYGADACADEDRVTRWHCLSSLFSETQSAAAPARGKIAALDLVAADVGVEELFPKATISFASDKNFPLLSAYRFTVELGEISPNIQGGLFSSGMSYLGGPYQLFWCGLKRLGQSIGRDVVLTKIYEDKRSRFHGLAIFVESEDSFSSITKGPLGGEWLAVMPLNRIQTKCEKLQPRSSQK